MARGATSSRTGENIAHFTAIRLRVVGSGNLRMSLYSLDDIRSTTLTPLVMSSATNIQPTVLANFIEQRASLEFKTTSIDEIFRINRILIYQKELFTSYPG